MRVFQSLTDSLRSFLSWWRCRFRLRRYLYPTTVTAPRGSYQSVTAVVQGVNNKTVTWTTDGGTIVGTNPCVVNEPCTAALYTTVAGTYHLTATSNANGSVSATSTITITGSPTPVTTHPRLLITAAMLPGLQAKATEQHAVSSAAGASDLRIQCRQQRLVLVVQRWHRSSFGERGEQLGTAERLSLCIHVDDRSV